MSSLFGCVEKNAPFSGSLDRALMAVFGDLKIGFLAVRLIVPR
jgi:hypothetical protein